MKVTIILNKNEESGADNYTVSFQVYDGLTLCDPKKSEIHSIIDKFILRLCIKPHSDGWIVRTLASRLRCGKFSLWELVGIRNILLSFDGKMYTKFNNDYREELTREREAARNEARPQRSVASPAMRLFRHVRDEGSGTLSLQQHFLSYGVSEATFYRWFYDHDRERFRKDIQGKDRKKGKAVRGMGIFRAFEMNGLMHYICKFDEVMENLNPIPGVDEYEISMGPLAQ